jgi:outer membrane protein TolC
VGPLVALPPPPRDADPGAVPATHPALAEWTALAEEASARQHAAERSADPVLAVQGTVYGRGTGVLDDNTSGTGADGLGLDAYNWAIGLTVSVPVMEWSNKHQREAVEALRVKAAGARQQDVAREMRRRVEVARLDRDAARDVASQTVVITESARQVAAQARARYQAGLNGITDVADAERRLAQAEIDRGLADLAIWRAHFALAYATADGVESFLRALP